MVTPLVLMLKHVSISCYPFFLLPFLVGPFLSSCCTLHIRDVVSYTALHTMEFQKRGLPHAHILAWLADDNREVSPTPIDSFISAEISDPIPDPLGYVLVSEFMINGPCGSLNERCPCMKNGVCSKHYPNTFQNETTTDTSGFSIYKHSDNNCYIEKNSCRLDNRWVVTYNMPLLKKY